MYNSEKHTKEYLLERIGIIDAALRKNKPVIDKYAGRSMDELGEEIFVLLMILSEKTVAIMREREVYADELRRKYGIFVV